MPRSTTGVPMPGERRRGRTPAANPITGDAAGVTSEALLQAEGGTSTAMKDASDELLEDALRTTAETEQIGTQTLGQLRRQGEQLSAAQTHVQATDETVHEARDVLKEINRKICREKLWLWLIILMLLAIDGLLAYRLATNDGQLSSKKGSKKKV